MITCHFCSATVPDVSAAVETGWVPSWYEPGDTLPTDEPVCQACAAEYLEEDPEDGELVRVADPRFDRRAPKQGATA